MKPTIAERESWSTGAEETRATSATTKRSEKYMRLYIMKFPASCGIEYFKMSGLYRPAAGERIIEINGDEQVGDAHRI